MKEVLERKIAERAEVRAEKRKGGSVWSGLFRSFFAFLLAAGALAVMVILALNHELSAIVAAVLGLVILLAGTFVSQTVTTAFMASLPDLIQKIRSK